MRGREETEWCKVQVGGEEEEYSRDGDGGVPWSLGGRMAGVCSVLAVRVPEEIPEDTLPATATSRQGGSPGGVEARKTRA